jgi:hypothetical protein
VTAASAVTVAPLMTPLERSAQRRFRIFIPLVGLYLFIAFAAPILTGETGFLLLNSGWREVDQHWLYGCVVLIGVWIAVGPGQMGLRAVQGLIAAGWLLLTWLVGLTMSPNWKFELVLTTAVCAAVATTTFVALVVMRVCFGKTLVLKDQSIAQNARRCQYSLATLFLVMLLVCATLTLFGWIDPKYKNDFSLKLAWYFTTSGQWNIWKVSLGPLLIAAACLPAFLCHHQRGFVWALLLSVAAVALTVLIDAYSHEFVLFPLVQGNAVGAWITDRYLMHDAANLITVALSLLTAAVAMRWLGYRIEEPRSHSAWLRPAGQ